MRFLPTRLHGAIDYLWGVVLLVSPFALGFAGPARVIAWIFGAGAILYSLVTDYELGLVRVVPVPLHLGLDALAGGLLALSPLAFGLTGAPAWLFGCFGIFAVLASLVTRQAPAAA